MAEKSNDRTVLITGAAGALGSALSRLFVEHGFNTIMVDKEKKGLESAWDSIVSEGLNEPILHPLNLATAGPRDFGLLIETVQSEFGGLDGVIHCAARFTGLRPLDQISPQEWLEQIQVNLNAAWLLSIACLPTLRNAHNSFLVFMLEDLKLMKGGYWGAYGASKLALEAIVHQFSAQCSGSSVKVLGVNPGPFASRLRSEAYHSEDPATVPGPAAAARKILELLWDENGSGVIVDLND